MGTANHAEFAAEAASVPRFSWLCVWPLNHMTHIIYIDMYTHMYISYTYDIYIYIHTYIYIYT